MNFSVLVKISRNELSFWQQNDTSPYEPLAMKEGNIVPLFFYINGSDFMMGNIARDRSNSNDPNAYCDYFNLITDPSKYFTIHGDSKPAKQLIYYGIENYLSHFIKTVLYKNDSIEAYRQNFCLRFWFDSDIEEKERKLIETIFKEAGYDNAIRIDYYPSLFKSFSSKNLLSNGSPLILLNSIANCLYINYFNFPQPGLISFKKLEGQGSDPRVKILATLILEDIKASSKIRFEKDEELSYIIPSIVRFLKNPGFIIEDEVTFTSGKKFYFKVRLNDIESRLTYDQGFSKIDSVIREIITENNIDSKLLNIFIIGDQINTPYLIGKLINKYSDSKVLGIENSFIDSALGFLFNQIVDSGYKFQSKPIVTAAPPTPMPPKATAPPTMPQKPMGITPPRSTAPPPMPPKVTAPPPMPPKVSAPPPLPPKVSAPPPMPPKVSVPLPPPINKNVPPPPPPPVKKSVPPPPPIKKSVPPPIPKKNNSSLLGNNAELEMLISSGQILAAIKYLKDKRNIGLKEGKELIENYLKNIKK